jgi:hypothetical protein
MEGGYAIRHSKDNNVLRGQKHNSDNPFRSPKLLSANPKLLIGVDLRTELTCVVELILLQKYCDDHEFITNSKCPLCNPSQSQNHCCDLHNVVDITVTAINTK